MDEIPPTFLEETEQMFLPGGLLQHAFLCDSAACLPSSEFRDEPAFHVFQDICRKDPLLCARVLLCACEDIILQCQGVFEY